MEPPAYSDKDSPDVAAGREINKYIGSDSTIEDFKVWYTSLPKIWQDWVKRDVAIRLYTGKEFENVKPFGKELCSVVKVIKKRCAEQASVELNHPAVNIPIARRYSLRLDAAPGQTSEIRQAVGSKRKRIVQDEEEEGEFIEEDEEEESGESSEEEDEHMDEGEHNETHEGNLNVVTGEETASAETQRAATSESQRVETTTEPFISQDTQLVSQISSTSLPVSDTQLNLSAPMNPPPPVSQPISLPLTTQPIASQVTLPPLSQLITAPVSAPIPLASLAATSTTAPSIPEFISLETGSSSAVPPPGMAPLNPFRRGPTMAGRGRGRGRGLATTAPGGDDGNGRGGRGNASSGRGRGNPPTGRGTGDPGARIPVSNAGAGIPVSNVGGGRGDNGPGGGNGGGGNGGGNGGGGNGGGNDPEGGNNEGGNAEEPFIPKNADGSEVVITDEMVTYLFKMLQEEDYSWVKEDEFSMFKYVGFNPHEVNRALLVKCMRKGLTPTEFKKDLTTMCAISAIKGSITDNNFNRMDSSGQRLVEHFESRYDLVRGGAYRKGPDVLTIPRIGAAFPGIILDLIKKGAIQGRSFEGPMRSRTLPSIMKHQAFAAAIPHSLDEKVKDFLIDIVTGFSIDQSMNINANMKKNQDPEEMYYRQRNFVKLASSSDYPDEETRISLFTSLDLKYEQMEECKRAMMDKIKVFNPVTEREYNNAVAKL